MKKLWKLVWSGLAVGSLGGGLEVVAPAVVQAQWAQGPAYYPQAPRPMMAPAYYPPPNPWMAPGAYGNPYPYYPQIPMAPGGWGTPPVYQPPVHNPWMATGNPPITAQPLERAPGVRPEPVPTENPAIEVAAEHAGAEKALDADHHDFCPPEKHGCRVLGGASLYYLRPGGNAAFVTDTTPTPAPGAIFSTNTTDFNWSYQPAAAFWLGFTGENGLGMRGRYFYLRQNADDLSQTLTPTDVSIRSITAPPSLGFPIGNPGFRSPGTILNAFFLGIFPLGVPGNDVTTFSSTLDIQSLDIEGTYDLRRGRMLLQFSGGARYQRIQQGYSASLTNNSIDDLGSPITETQVLTASNNFTGAGPTAALQANYQIGNSNFSLFGNLRGTLLVGQSTQERNFLQTITDPNLLIGGDTTTGSSASSTHSNMLVPVAEIELGAQYGVLLGGNLYAFVRGAVVSQTYFGIGTSSEAEGNLGLFGGQISLGFNF